MGKINLIPIVSLIMSAYPLLNMSAHQKYSRYDLSQFVDDSFITVQTPDSANWIPSNQFIVSLPIDYKGRLQLNSDVIRQNNLKVTMSYGIKSVQLTPFPTKDPLTWVLYSDESMLGEGWTLNIPAEYFKIEPTTEEVDSLDIDKEELRRLDTVGAWHSKSEPKPRRPMFTIQDDDGITGTFENTDPKEYSSWGYFSILYPVLESLGLKGTVSLEGRKGGFTSSPPALNETGMLAKRIQDEKGWEIQCHSMICLGELLNCWEVDDLDSELASRIFEEGPRYGPRNPYSVSVYSISTGKQYMPATDGKEWVEADPDMVKPYVGDFTTKKSLFYDDNYDVDYHWGEWFRIAEQLGIDGKCWVGHNNVTSHILTPKINAICKNGFADCAGLNINVPPLLTTVARCQLEGQQLPDFKGGNDPDNTYDAEAMAFFRHHLQDALDRNGWIVFGLHAYRPCWKNYIPGALVSEGGTYPDSWVAPLAGIDPLSDPLTPPEALGIKDWSEWHPCPGTRLYMMWELFKEARDKGMACVTSAEGYELIGNQESEGYYTNGYRIGQNVYDIAGTSNRYPHYIVSADGEVSYYNPAYNEEITIEGIDITDTAPFRLEIHSIDGISYSPGNEPNSFFSLRNLPKGIWIVNGTKYLITK